MEFREKNRSFNSFVDLALLPVQLSQSTKVEIIESIEEMLPMFVSLFDHAIIFLTTTRTPRHSRALTPAPEGPASICP